jgi:hypothetical protein
MSVLSATCFNDVDAALEDLERNTFVGLYSVFTRGMMGVYQNRAVKHLNSFIAEFHFRNQRCANLAVDDRKRAQNPLPGSVGKRLPYHSPD